MNDIILNTLLDECDKVRDNARLAKLVSEVREYQSSLAYVRAFKARFAPQPQCVPSVRSEELCRAYEQ